MNHYNPAMETIAYNRFAQLTVMNQIYNHKVGTYVLPLGESHNPLIMIVGPPGSDKGRLAREYCRKHPKLAKLAVTYTSRAKLCGEVNGESYYFVSEDKMKKMSANGELVTVWRKNGSLYGMG